MAFARRYELMKRDLSKDLGVWGSRAAREVMWNTARQSVQIHRYLVFFFREIEARASAMESYEDRAAFVGDHLTRLFEPALKVLLDGESGSAASVRRASAGSGSSGPGGGGGPGGAPSPAKGILMANGLRDPACWKDGNPNAETIGKWRELLKVLKKADNSPGPPRFP
jgi:hypothetical protein